MSLHLLTTLFIRVSAPLLPGLCPPVQGGEGPPSGGGPPLTLSALWTFPSRLPTQEGSQHYCPL